jgi:hypothetical protein
MSSWLISRVTATHKGQLITTAVVSGVIAAGAVIGFQRVRRRYRVYDLKASIPDISQEHVATKVSIFEFLHRNSRERE